MTGVMGAGQIYPKEIDLSFQMSFLSNSYFGFSSPGLRVGLCRSWGVGHGFDGFDADHSRVCPPFGWRGSPGVAPPPSPAKSQPTKSHSSHSCPGSPAMRRKPLCLDRYIARRAVDFSLHMWLAVPGLSCLLGGSQLPLDHCRQDVADVMEESHIILYRLREWESQQNSMEWFQCC